MTLIIGQSGGVLPDPLVQAATPGAPTQSSATATFANNPTVGNIMVGIAVCRNGGDRITMPSGWTLIGSRFEENESGAPTGRMSYRIVVGGDGKVYTATSTGNDFPSFYAAEFKAVSAAGTNSATGQGPSATPSISLTPTGAGPWVEVCGICGGGDGAGSSGPIAVAGGFTAALINHTGSGDAFAPYVVLMYKAVSVGVNPSITAPNKKYAGAAIALQR